MKSNEIERLNYYKKMVLGNESLENWLIKRSEYCINKNKELGLEKDSRNYEEIKRFLDLNYQKIPNYQNKWKKILEFAEADIEAIAMGCLDAEKEEYSDIKGDYTGVHGYSSNSPFYCDKYNIENLLEFPFLKIADLEKKLEEEFHKAKKIITNDKHLFDVVNSLKKENDEIEIELINENLFSDSKLGIIMIDEENKARSLILEISMMTDNGDVRGERLSQNESMELFFKTILTADEVVTNDKNYYEMAKSFKDEFLNLKNDFQEAEIKFPKDFKITFDESDDYEDAYIDFFEKEKEEARRISSARKPIKI